MRIAVLSDTHDQLRSALLSGLCEADEIWHLGDVCAPALLMELKQLGPPVTVVRGNCDWVMDWPPALMLEREGFRCQLVHIPPSIEVTGVNMVLHGHTHRPRDEQYGSMRFLNPGSAGLANKGAPLSFAWLTLEAGKPAGWNLVLLH